MLTMFRAGQRPILAGDPMKGASKMTDTTVTPVRNPYLLGNFRPVREEITVLDLPVTGTVPDHLDGRYARTGPNPITDPDPAMYHWFLGTGMVHGVRLCDGRAEWYRNRFVRSADVAEILGEPTRPGPLPPAGDFAANTNVFQQDGRTFVSVEGGSNPYELTYDLQTVSRCNFDGTLEGPYTPHPLRDPATGELHAVSYFAGWGNRVQYTVLGTDARIRRTVAIECAGSPAMHSFSLTENHVVVYDLPVTFDPEMIPPDFDPAFSNIFPYRWDPDYQARIGVLPRDGNAEDVRWFEIAPCYVFHAMNAYDDDDHIVIDVVRHPKMFASEVPGPNEDAPTLDRWTIDLGAGRVVEDRLDEHAQEFPRVDERLTGRRHRYGYSVGGKLQVGDSVLYKYDFHARRQQSRSFGSGRGLSEFVFVPSESDAAEDDGILMGFIHDAANDVSDLVMVDAATLETVAAVHLPVRVPNGFHGNWLPDGTE
jgi:carotenoid cleavage dioxygenase